MKEGVFPGELRLRALFDNYETGGSESGEADEVVFSFRYSESNLHGYLVHK